MSKDSLSDSFNAIELFYNARVNKFGNHFKACDYGRSESQQIKFKVLSEFGHLNEKTLLDVGCGFGDYSTFLDKFALKKYTGIDLSEKMIEEGKKAHPSLDLQKINFLDAHFQDRFDVITANGIFYLLGDNAFELMKTLIQKMYQLSNFGIAFNSLSSWADQQDENEFYANPAATFEFCKTLTPFVTLRHDYFPHDFTIYMYHSNTW